MKLYAKDNVVTIKMKEENFRDVGSLKTHVGRTKGGDYHVVYLFALGFLIISRIERNLLK